MPRSETWRMHSGAANNLALQALVAAFADDNAIVDESATRTTIAKVTAEYASYRHPDHQRHRRTPSSGSFLLPQLMLTINAAVVLILSAGSTSRRAGRSHRYTGA
jgi:hypothetical protein